MKCHHITFLPSLLAQLLSCLTICDLWTVAHQAPPPWYFPGKNTVMGCHALLQKIFPTQGSNPGLPHLPSEPPGKGILLGQFLKIIRTRNSFLCLFHFLPSGIRMSMTIIICLSHHCILEAWALLSFSLIHRCNRASLVAQRLNRLPLMQETWVRSLDWENPLEKEMATHSSILAWRIPWTEEPGGLQSTGSQRVGHNWATSLSHM